MPDWLWWLTPVLLAPVAAAAWNGWNARSRGPQEPEDTMRAHERFRAAFGTPLPGMAQHPDLPRQQDPSRAAARD